MTTNANVERTAVLGKLKMACEAFAISAERGRALEIQIREFIDKIQGLERAAAEDRVESKLARIRAALVRAKIGDLGSIEDTAEQLVDQLQSTQMDVEMLTRQRDAALADVATLKGCVERLQAGPHDPGPILTVERAQIRHAVADAYQAAIARDAPESAPADRVLTANDHAAVINAVDPRHALERQVKIHEHDVAAMHKTYSDLARVNHNLRAANARLCSIRDRQRNIIEHRGVVALVDIDDKDIGYASWQKRDTELGEGWVLKFPQRYVAGQMVDLAASIEQVADHAKAAETSFDALAKKTASSADRRWDDRMAAKIAEPRVAEQPIPKFDESKPDLWIEVVRYALRAGYRLTLTDLMIKRRALGVSRYGTPLQPFNGRDAKRDLREEMLDATVYAAQVAVERVGGGDPQAALSSDVQFKEILAITNAVVCS